MKHGISIVAVAAVMLAIAAPAMAIHVQWSGGATGAWGTTASTDWTRYISGVPTTPFLPDLASEKVVLGEVGSEVVTLSHDAGEFITCEFYVASKLIIADGGLITCDEMGIYTDQSSRVILEAGGTLKVKTGQLWGGAGSDGDAGLIGYNGISYADTDPTLPTLGGVQMNVVGLYDVYTLGTETMVE